MPRELVRDGLAEDRAGRIEQDHGGVRPTELARARPPPAPGAGPCPHRHRRCSRRPSGGGRDPTPRRSWTRTVARPRSRIRPGMLSRSGPSTIAGKSVRTSTSSAISRRRGCGPEAAAARVRLAGTASSASSRSARPPGRTARPMRVARPRADASPWVRVPFGGWADPWASAASSDGGPRADVVLVVDRPGVEVQRIACPRSSRRDRARAPVTMPPYAGHVDLAARTAHDEHLGAAGAVDVTIVPRSSPVPSSGRRAPRARGRTTGRARAARPARRSRGTRSRRDSAASRSGTSRKLQPPARPVRDGRCLVDGQRLAGALHDTAARPTMNRSSGRSVSSSTRTWPRSPRRPRTSATTRRAGRLRRRRRRPAGDTGRRRISGAGSQDGLALRRSRG